MENGTSWDIDLLGLYVYDVYIYINTNTIVGYNSSHVNFRLLVDLFVSRCSRRFPISS